MSDNLLTKYRNQIVRVCGRELAGQSLDCQRQYTVVFLQFDKPQLTSDGSVSV